MKYKVNFAKRSLMLFLVAWITFTSVFFAYHETAKSAEWIAGTIATIAGAPILTTLVIGGVVVAGGIALYELSQTNAEDHRAFVNGIKTGFEQFVSDQEAKIAKENDQTLTDQQAADIGVANARDTVNNFVRNAIDVTVTTGQDLKAKTVDYWKKYSSIISEVADDGISVENPNTIPSATNPVTIPVENFTNYNVQTNRLTNSLNGFVKYGDNYYINKGYFGDDIQEFTNSDPNVMYVPFVRAFPSSQNSYIVQLSYFSLNPDYTFKDLYVLSTKNFYDLNIDSSSFINFLNSCTFPICVMADANNFYDWISENYNNLCSVVVSAVSVPIWKRTINNTLTNTHIGSAIQTGRRQLVNEGDEITSVFVQDSVPVKKTGVEVNEGVVSAPVGWDIPAGSTWDDVFSGNRPFSDVVDDTGCVSVPSDDIIGANPTDTVVDYPVSTDVQDSSDYPKSDVDDPSWSDDRPQETPDRPYQDILDEQGGSFYPAAMDISELFPFCIPFDIYYLIQKFTVQQGEAPVITIPIVYPGAIQSAMGTDHYDVVIDMNDYIVLRNIIRIFLLLLFIIGLMQITRNLIRG